MILINPTKMCRNRVWASCLIMRKFSIYRHLHIHELSDPNFISLHIWFLHILSAKIGILDFFSSRLLFSGFEHRGIKMVDDGVVGPAYPSGTSGRHSQLLMKLYIAIVIFCSFLLSVPFLCTLIFVFFLLLPCRYDCFFVPLPLNSNGCPITKATECICHQI